MGQLFQQKYQLIRGNFTIDFKKKKFSDIEIEVLDVIGSNPEKEKRLMGCDFVRVCVCVCFFFLF